LTRLEVTSSISRRVGVVDPGDVLLGQLLKDGLVRKTTIVEGSIIATMTVTGTGSNLGNF
jgi:hypothetical protein